MGRAEGISDVLQVDVGMHSGGRVAAPRRGIEPVVAVPGELGATGLPTGVQAAPVGVGRSGVQRPSARTPNTTVLLNSPSVPAWSVWLIGSPYFGMSQRPLVSNW